MKDLLKSINPKLKDSYSPNLYRYVRHQHTKYFRELLNVYRHDNGNLWIGFVGDFDDFIGSPLISSLVNGGRQPRGCFPKTAHKLTLLEYFWPYYIEIGLCVIDPEHKRYFIDGESRWKMTSKNIRTCQWCNEFRQVKKTRIVKTTVESWEQTQ